MRGACSINAQFPCKSQSIGDVLLHYSVPQICKWLKKPVLPPAPPPPKAPQTPHLFKFTQFKFTGHAKRPR